MRMLVSRGRTEPPHPLADRRLEQLEDLLGRLHPVRAGVEVGAEGAQGQVGLGREDEHEEGGVEVHVPIEQSQADGHRDQGHRDGGQQLEDERGEEGQPEGGQRRGPVAVGDLGDGPGLGLGPAEDLQGGQAGHHVEEVPGQPLERPHAGSRAVPRGQPHQAHEHRDQGHGHRDEDGRDPVGAGHHGDDGHRDDDGQEELGQVAGEVAVEGVDPGGHEHGEPSVVLLLQAGRAQGGDVLGRRVPQLRLGRGRGPVGRPSRSPRPARRARR